MAYENHWLPGFNFNVEEWFAGDRYETLAICRTLALARAAFRGCDRGEARRQVHDQKPDAGGDAPSGRRLVSVSVSGGSCHIWEQPRSSVSTSRGMTAYPKKARITTRTKPPTTANVSTPADTIRTALHAGSQASVPISAGTETSMSSRSSEVAVS